MADDEAPKDYSSRLHQQQVLRMCPPVPQMRRSSGLMGNDENKRQLINNNANNSTQATTKSSNFNSILLDGARAIKRQSEGDLDFSAVAQKLKGLSSGAGGHHRLDDHRLKTLTKHYSYVFDKTKSIRSSSHQHHQHSIAIDTSLNRQPQVVYKTYIQYHDEKEAYVVNVKQNTLRAVREKMPRPGNYRYFFKQLDNTREEVESEDSRVPYHERAGSMHIFCHVFPF